MANTKISALTANTNPNWNEEFVYAYNNANGKITLDTMKTFVGWAGITTLNADANIWDLNEWTYVTTHDLYYKTWEKVPTVWGSWSTKKQMLFVTVDSSSWAKWFFVFNAWSTGSSYLDRAAFGYSVSSSVWTCKRLWAWDASLERYDYMLGGWTQLQHPDWLTDYTITQVINNINDNGTNSLAISTANPPYPWVTYTILVNSVQSWQTYTITLWNWVTNPLNIALPNASNKKCVITVLITSTTTGIVTWCTMES